MTRLYITLLVVFLLLTQTTKAQWVTIPDGNFLIFLQNSDVAGCLNGNQLDASCPAVVNKTILDCSNFGIADLTGLEAFVNLQELHCDHNLLTTLPTLPNGLKKLSCYYNQLTVLPALPNGITDLVCANNQLSSLPSLPDSVTWFSCKQNHLTNLPALPNGLKVLYCYENQLTALPSLPNTITDLGCYTNQITTLPALPDSLKWLDCSANHIAVIPALPNKLYHIQCQSNLLTALPSLPNSLKELSCCCNQITVLPSLPAGLTFLFCSNNQLTDLPSLPSTLTYLACAANQLTVLPPLPSVLTVLMCGGNQLTEIPPLANVMDLLNIQNNPGITCLPPVEKITGNVWGWTSSIGGTGITCLPNVIQHPGSIPSIDTLPVCGIFNPNSCPVAWNVSGKVYRDDNADCQINAVEPRLKNIKLLLTQGGNLLQQVYSNIDGRFSFDTDLGTYQTSVDTTDLPFNVTCPSNNSHASNVVATDSLDYTADFALQCNPGYDLVVQSVVRDYGLFFPAHTAHVRIDAGDLAHYYGVSCNTVALGGTVTATYSGPVNVYAISGNGVQNGNTVTWTVSDFSQLNFFNDFGITFMVDTIPATNSMCVNVSINPSSGTDNNPSNNGFMQCFAVVNSFDPNVKEVYPSSDIQPNEGLTYTVHFQNTGTAPAINILVIDTLDANLDWSTFQLLGYSHENMTQVLPNGVVHFNFPNIYLPDSTSDEPGSHGWIQYRIKAKSTLAPNTTVHNSASIYFDFNAPVVTNDAAVFSSCAPQQIFQSLQVCLGDSVPVGNHWHKYAAVYTDTLTGTFGCDSTVITNLTVLQPTAGSASYSVCVGDSALIGGVWRHEAGVYTFQTLNATGCDSVVTSTLSLIQPSVGSQTYSVCTGDSVDVNGVWYAQAGVFVQSLTNAAGCDSTLNVTVSLLQPSSSNYAYSVCAGDSVEVNGVWYGQSGMFLQSFTNALGCDSTVTIALTTLQPTAHEEAFSVCQGDSVYIGGAWQHAAGTYIDHLTNTAGCDSTVTTTLTLLQPTSSAGWGTFCEGDSVNLDGVWHHDAGVYTLHYNNAVGCDSSVSFTLFMLEPSSLDQSFNLCSGESVTVGSNVYNQTGVYTNHFVNEQGCDSTVVTTVNVSTIDTALTVSGATITATPDAASYQWFDCDNGQPMLSDTLPLFTAAHNGNYAVQLAYGNGCSITSSCVNVTGVGIATTHQGVIHVYPNPSNGQVHFDFNGMKGKLTVYNALGQTVTLSTVATKIVDLENLPAGMLSYKFVGDRGDTLYGKLSVVRTR